MPRLALALLFAATAADLSALAARVGSLDGIAATPAGRSGKGGRQVPAAPAPPPPAVARSGKGGRQQEQAATLEDMTSALEDIRKQVRSERVSLDRSSRPDPDAITTQVVNLAEFKRAKTVRVHLNRRAYGVRLAALRAGKSLVVTQGGLDALYVVDPAKIKKRSYEEAATAAGVRKFGTKVDVNEPIKVDLFLVKSMAVDPSSGCRVGPAGSSEELEYAMLSQMRAISKKTPVVTTADTYSLVKGMASKDGPLCTKVPADIICTPAKTIRPRRSLAKLVGLDFEKLNEYRFRTMRLLRRLRAKTRDGELGKKPTAATPKFKAAATARSGKGGRA